MSVEDITAGKINCIAFRQFDQKSDKLKLLDEENVEAYGDS